MNTVYKLVFNTSTGTWAITHEFAAARGKKSRTRLATAMAVAIALPAGASMAADSPQPLQCGINETISADGLRCEAAPMMSVASGGIGTMATADEQDRFIKFGAAYGASAGSRGTSFDTVATASGALAVGRASSALLWGSSFGSNAASAVYGTAIGIEANAAGARSTALGSWSWGSGDGSVALGSYSTASGTRSIAIGGGPVSGGAANRSATLSSGANAISMGSNAQSTGSDSISIGNSAVSSANDAISIGSQITNNAARSILIGNNYVEADAASTGSFAVGTAGGTVAAPYAALTNSANAIALLGSASNAASGTAIGYNSSVTASGAVALGSESTAQVANTVSVGNANLKRKIVNVDDAALTATSDEAVTGRQLFQTNADLTDLNDKIGDSGLVDANGDTRAAVTYDKNADGTPNYASVTLGNGSTTPVQIKNVAAGTDANDAVNFSQLQAATTNPYFAGNGAGNAAQATSRNSVALGINSVADSINTVSVGNAVTGLTRRITNVADGQNANDAATLGQVQSLLSGSTRTTSKSIAAVNEKLDAMSKSGLMAAVDDTYFQVDAQPGDAAAHVRAGSSALALGSGANSTGDFGVAIGTDSEASGTQSVAIGAEARATATGALAMGHAQATGVESVALGDGTVASGANAVATGFNARAAGTNAVAMGNTAHANAGNAMALGTLSDVDAAATSGLAVGYGAQVTATGLNAVALGANSSADRANVVSVGSSAQQRQIINVAAGTADTDAVNFSQLKTYVSDNAGSDPLAVAYSDDTKAEIALAGTDGTTISNVKAGEVAATSTDAINGAQLYGTAKSVADNLGGGAVVNTDGTVSAPSYSIGGTNYGNVGAAFDAVDGSLTDLAGQVADSGLVDADGDTRAAVTYDKNTDGTPNYASVTLGESGTAVKLTNVAAGAVSSTSTDAVNGSQLYGTAKSVADAIGGGSTVGTDGTITAPSFSIGGTDHASVGDAFDAVDTSLTDLNDKIGDSGLVDANGDTRAAVTYDKNPDGTPNYASVTLGNGSTTPVQIKNVAAGTDANDAVNFSQLQAATTNPYFAGAGTGTAARASSRNSVALGINSVADSINTVSVGDAATGLTRRITNVAAGQGDSDAATVGQVNSLVSGVSTSTTKTLNDFESRLSALGTIGTMAAVDDEYIKVGTATGGIAAEVTADNDGVAIGSGSKGTGSFAVAIGADSEASGTQSVAIGPEAKATANGALAMGHAQATGIESVALGDGTIASGANALASGFNARATGTNAVALGNTSHAYGENSMAVGTTSSVDTAASNGLAMGANAAVMAAGINSVALGAGSVADRSNVVSVGTATQQRQIVNVAAGTADTDAVNFSQLKDYVANNGGGGTGNPLAVGYADDTKAEVALEGTDGTTISNVKAGDVSDTSTDAINGAQLAGTAQSVADAIGGGSTVAADGTLTAPTFTIGGTDHASVGDAFDAVDTSLTDLDGRVTKNEGDITTLNTQLGDVINGTAGLVQQAAAGAELTVGKDTDGASVNFTGTAGDRTLAGVAAGAVSATSNQAINGSQLFATAQSVADGFGGGSVVNANGTISAPSYMIGGTTYNNVGGALTNLDGRLGTAETDLADLIANGGGNGGGAGNNLVVQDPTTSAITVGAATAGTSVDFTGTVGPRKLTGIAAGEVSATSTDAMTGAQLAGTAQSVADAIGGGATVAADGTITAPSFDIDGTSYANVGDAFEAVDTSLTDLDGRVTQNEGDITNINTQLGDIVNGTAGLVQQAGAGAELTVGKDTDGDTVNFAGTAGARTLSGVANGTADSDAATIAQVKAMGLIDPNDGRALAALVYDDIGLARATLGGSNGTVIANLGDGLIAAGSREAVNGGQLWQMNADLEARWSDLDSRVGVIEAGSGGSGGGNGGGGNVGPGTGDDSLVIGDGSNAGGNGSIGAGNGADAGGNGSVAIGDGASAGGEGGVAVGRNTDASGDGSVAIGDGAGASGNDSVAIGHGSTADRDNEFSVGSEGNERIVSNVGAGVRPTDAVNVQQMDDRFQAERQYTDSRFQAVDKRMDRMGAISAAYAGMALNTAGLSGDNRVGAGMGNQNGRTALAVGYQRILGEKKNVSLSLGGAFSGSERSVTAGAGFSW